MSDLGQNQKYRQTAPTTVITYINTRSIVHMQRKRTLGHYTLGKDSAMI